MSPARFVRSPERYEPLRQLLNEALSFSGLNLDENGQFAPIQAARNLDEAEERAGRLRKELERRAVHPDVLVFCRAELLDQDYFHAVLEATKSVADKIRKAAAVNLDGCPLVDRVFGSERLSPPLLVINDLATDSDRNEHKGFANLLRGVFQTFRNPTAHDPRIQREVTEQDAVDLLSLVSFLHRRLDEAHRPHGQAKTG
jgi:uncharacterized protein (TIGR02391 family)